MDGFNHTFSSTTDALFSAERAALSFLPRSAKTMADRVVCKGRGWQIQQLIAPCLFYPQREICM
jgi:hypothetical protein